MTKNRRGLEWRPRLRFEVYFLREDMLLQAFQYNPLDLCWVASSEGPASAVSSGYAGSKNGNGPTWN